MPRFLATLLLLAVTSSPAASLRLDDLTSPELRDRIAAGTTTVLLPVGGSEQNGAHMVLGKHNVRAGVLAERIAERLGHTVVAPVLAYVPEGGIDPPQAHMRYAGTISIPEAAFEALLEGAARSLCHHGLRDVILLGDHGGYQRSLTRVAAKFARADPKRPCRVHAVSAYYDAADAGMRAILTARGHAADEIGRHAGLADTALALAVDPALVRADKMAAGRSEGVDGDPRRASIELGRLGVERIVDATVLAIRARLGLK